MGSMQGSIIGVIKGNAWNLDYSSFKFTLLIQARTLSHPEPKFQGPVPGRGFVAICLCKASAVCPHVAYLYIHIDVYMSIYIHKYIEFCFLYSPNIQDSQGDADFETLNTWLVSLPTSLSWATRIWSPR